MRDVMRGWAGEIIGEMVVRDWGRVGLFGKRIGDTKGLEVNVS